jgi:hypothetical protein
MLRRKKERFKTYIAIGLAMLFGVMAYFRFIHAEVKTNAEPNSSLSLPDRFDLPRVAIADLKEKASQLELPVQETLHNVIRDIFEPVKLPQKRVRHVTAEAAPQPNSSLQLRGVIVGGGTPIAIINDQVLRTGDQIGAYKVISIGKKEVVLGSKSEMLELHLVGK